MAPADETTSNGRLRLIFSALGQRRFYRAEPLLRVTNRAAAVRTWGIGINPAIAECLDLSLANLL
jgi:hypothetical protein